MRIVGRRGRSLLAVLAVALLALLLSPAAEAPAATTAPKTVGLLALNTNQVTDAALGKYTRYRDIVVQRWHPEVVTKVRSRTTTSYVLAYLQMGAVTYQSSCPLLGGSALPGTYDAAPISYCWIAQNHPDWLLRDTQGRVIHFADFPQMVAVDPGNQDLRNLWIKNALALVKPGKFNGAFFDDVGIQPAHGMADGKAYDIAKYTDFQYGTLMGDFVAQAGRAFRYNGLQSIGNVGANFWVPWQVNVVTRLASSLTAVNREFWIRWGTACGTRDTFWTDPSSERNPSLSQARAYALKVQGAGGRYSGEDYSSATPTTTDLAAMRYGRAFFLLNWNGQGGAVYFFRTCGGNDPAREAWTREMGLPTAGLKKSSAGVWYRTFQRGWVVLNPSPWTKKRIWLGSRVFVDTNGVRHTGWLTLGPRRAHLLRRVS